jgi:hypothetical protein
VKRYLPVLLVVGVTVFAALLAVGVNVGIGGALALPDGAEVKSAEVGSVAAAAGQTAGASVASKPRPRSKSQYVDEILGRNIFDHENMGSKAGPGTPGGSVITDLKLRLVATLVAEPATFSSALIVASDEKDAVANGYGIGAKLEDATVVAIEKRQVKLKRGDGSIELLVMDEEDAPVRTASRAPTGDDDEDDGIEQLGENKYAVDRSVVEKYLGDLESVSRMARAIPHRGPDGQIDGYRLSGIRRNSALDKLGIKNGDIVHGVNGQGLTSMQGAMGAYSSMQSESAFNFDVSRRGQKINLDYEVR